MNNNPFDNYRGTSDKSIRDNRPDLPMNWYKFLIWVALPVSAVVNILGAIPYFMGTSQTEEMLAQFPALLSIDRFYGILTLGMGIIALYTRFALAGYKKNAPSLIVGLYVYGLVISLGYNVIVLSITQSAVSHQLRILKTSNLVKTRREGKNIIYSLTNNHVRTIIDCGMEHITE